MKKVLLLSLSLALGFSAFAQQRVAKNDIRVAKASMKKTVVGKDFGTVSAQPADFAPQTAQSAVVNRFQNMDYASTMWTNYDLQSNQFVANRMYELPDGSVGVVATMSHESNLTASDRGTGYNFYKDGAWQFDDLDAMERVEPFKTGWPSIAQWGENGEILLAHGNNHLQCFTREVAGEGEWVDMGPLPDCPADYPYAEYATWPRVITSGDNHNIIHVVAALQHAISNDETEVRTVLYRSEDATNWEVSYGPLADLDLETNTFSADDYALAANGHNVAILYSGSLHNSVWMFKSTDDGLTWNSTKVWEDPYEGLGDVVYTDTLYRPMNGAITIDNYGKVHVALNTFMMTIDQQNLDEGTFSYWMGRSIDGIIYWNDSEEAPIKSPDGNPHYAARLWWPDPENPDYVVMRPDSTRWIGYIPMYQDIAWDNAKYYQSVNGNDYIQKLWGASGHPALSCDPQGNLACAFSAPCTNQTDQDFPYYKRHIYVSYRNVADGYWNQVVDDITDPEVIFELTYGESLFTFSAPNVVNNGEFWFGYQSDTECGFYWGGGTSNPADQQSATVNDIYVVKVTADPEMVSVPESYEAKDVVYSIYPNPATDYMVIQSSMDAEANISIVNIVGQTVSQFNKNLKMGANTIGLDLKSGIYFCTVTANGFSKTIKFVVK